MEPWEQATFLVGVLILILTAFRIGRRRRLRRAHAQIAAATAPERDDEDRRVTRTTNPSHEMGEILVQLQEVGREIEGRLDTRVRYAQRLLGEAEDVLGRLDRLIREARTLTAASEGSPSSSTPTPPPEPARFPFDEPVTRDPHEPRIAELAAQGRDAQSIANELDRPVGEVKLVLSLLRAKNRNGP